jgi:hypothetical protein
MEMDSIVLVLCYLIGGFVLGLLFARRSDVFCMFKGADGKVKEKKVALMLVISVVLLTFSWSYISVASSASKFEDVGWSWVALIAVTILSFLGPDALIKIATTFSTNISEGLAARLSGKDKQDG